MNCETKLNELAEAYLGSRQFAELAPATQRNTEKSLAKLSQFMHRPVKRLSRPVLVKLMDDMKPGAAYVFLTRMRAMFTWAIERGMLDTNPLLGITPPKTGEYRPWTAQELQTFLSCEDDQVRMAVTLALYTAQRLSDVLKMRWADITKDGAIYVRQKKTNVELYLPIHGSLRSALDGHPHGGDYIVSMRDGSRYTEDSFRRRFERKRDELGLPGDLTFHGLRKTMAAMLASKGATPLEIMHVGGWKSLRQVAHYCKGAEQFTMAKAAFARLMT